MSTSMASTSSSMFLKKLYDMLQTVPSTIGGWCENGTAFEIKNPKEFARVMLPQYFKHSKFSSFARQLNFYGFQKYKKEVLLVAHEPEQKPMTFYHQYFQQDRPRLMAKIKRKTNYTELASDSSSNVDEVEELRNEVSDIKASLAGLGSQVIELTQLLSKLVQTPEPIKEEIAFMDALEYLESTTPLESCYQMSQTFDLSYIDSIEPLSIDPIPLSSW